MTRYAYVLFYRRRNSPVERPAHFHRPGGAESPTAPGAAASQVRARPFAAQPPPSWEGRMAACVFEHQAGAALPVLPPEGGSSLLLLYLHFWEKYISSFHSATCYKAILKASGQAVLLYGSESNTNFAVCLSMHTSRYKLLNFVLGGVFPGLWRFPTHVWASNGNVFSLTTESSHSEMLRCVVRSDLPCSLRHWQF